MSGYRSSTVFVPLFGVEGKPSWRIGNDDRSWLLPDSPRTAAALLDLPIAADDVPLESAGPVAPPPPRPQPIGNAPIAEGLALPWLRYTEVNSRAEGHFLERFARGSMTRTLRERDYPVIGLLNHGQDPSAGMRPLGRMAVWEAQDGLRFSLAFLDTGYARDVAEGARAGLYGASVRFGTVREKAVLRPGRSPENQRGLETRTILEANLVEISMTPRPQYAGTSVAVAA